MAEVKIQEGESIESALRRFKRKVQQEDIIKDIKKHSFYLKPGDKRRAKQALARKRSRKKQRREVGIVGAASGLVSKRLVASRRPTALRLGRGLAGTGDVRPVLLADASEFLRRRRRPATRSLACRSRNGSSTT